jgi:hypothetical protein
MPRWRDPPRRERTVMIEHAHIAPRVQRRQRRRRGIALVTILALLALSSALLAGSFASATASARAARSSRAALVASAATRRALGRVLQGWSSAEDALPVGASIERDASEPSEVPRDAAETRVRIQRLSATLFVVASDVFVPSRVTPLARRRMRLIVRRSAAADSTLVRPPGAIVRWSLGELF